MNLKEKAKQLKINIPTVLLCLKDKKTPYLAKFFAMITICYALSPIDLIPDFIPVLGYIDDVIILPLLIKLTIHFIPSEIFNKYKKESENMWKNGKPSRWYFSIPIILIWVAIMWLIIKNIFF